MSNFAAGFKRMQMTTFNTYTFDNGLRMIHLASSSPVVYCGFQLKAGTRNEQSDEEGLAHFCEHVSFKGTSRRTAMQVLNGLESVGGELNAFTNKESTVFYAAILKEHLTRAIDLLTDIVFNSTYPQAEIDKEVEVICDEIESYNDSPSELIYDEFENMIFEGHALGHSILGTSERVRAFTTADAMRFTQRHYRPERAVFFVYGDVDFGQLIRIMGRQMASLHREEKAESKENGHSIGKNELPPYVPKTVERTRGTHQAHVMIGTRSYAYSHPLRIALYVLNNMLGGPAMNTRLNLALRERNALVYSVESIMVSYGDTGLWCTYFGCDPHDVKKCLRLVRREMDRFINQPLSENRLRTAKRQLKGQLGIACDNRESFALDFGKSFLHNGVKMDISTLYERIDAVTAEQLQQVASELFAEERLSTLIYD